MSNKLIIGIDVDKSYLSYAIVEGSASWEEMQGIKVKRISNEASSILSFLTKFSTQESLFVFEPTGSYSDKLKCLLQDHGYSFSLVNPSHSHHFSQLLSIGNKNDAQSARMLALMGQSLNLKRYQGGCPELARRKRALGVMNGLVKQERMLKNQIHAQEQYYDPYPELINSMKRSLKRIEQEIEKLRAHLKKSQSPSYLKVKKLAMSVSGVGPVTADWLLSLAGSLEHFDTAKQLVKYCGLAPGKQQSGSSVNKKMGVSKKASAMLRASLFMGARSAIRYNKACKDLYQRLRAKGKTFYQAIVAVMAKLVRQIFGVVKSEKPFDNAYYLKFQKN